MKSPLDILNDKLKEIKTEADRLLKMHNESTDVNFRSQLIMDWTAIVVHQRIYESNIQILKIWTEI